MKANNITLEQSLLQELFDYKNGQLVWKKKPANLKHLIGVVAGCLHHSGYRNIKIGKNVYPAHRLVWIYHYGSIDKDLQIDHINGIKDDNNIENLRLVTIQENCFNRSKLTAKGYSWNKNEKKWQAQIWVEGKLKYLGLYLNEQDARSAYLNASSMYHTIGTTI
jgi:HNH endonuclease